MIKINKKVHTEEPMHCWRKGCKEEFNGLMRYSIELGDGFFFETWCCGDCEKLLDKKIKESKDLKFSNEKVKVEK